MEDKYCKYWELESIEEKLGFCEINQKSYISKD